MSKTLSTAAAVIALGSAPALILLGVAAMGAAHAAPLSLHSYYAHRAHHRGHAGPMYGYQPQQSVSPQFNNQGPQISVPPQTGNAVDQLSPLMGARQPDPLGIK
jgi:hypothetical protein